MEFMENLSLFLFILFEKRKLIKCYVLCHSCFLCSIVLWSRPPFSLIRCRLTCSWFVIATTSSAISLIQLWSWICSRWIVSPDWLSRSWNNGISNGTKPYKGWVWLKIFLISREKQHMRPFLFYFISYDWIHWNIYYVKNIGIKPCWIELYPINFLGKLLWL